jgi:formate-dependent nitrite reductase membrane component NrfD
MMFRVPKYHQSFQDTPVRQTEWAEGSGLLFITAIFLGGVGSGTYVLGVFFDVLPALIVGWTLIVVGKGGFHLLYLGRPWRAWRALANVRHSWLSRGIWGLGIFAVAGAAYIAQQIQESPATVASWTLGALSLLSAVFVMIYEGFLLRKAVGIPVWNTWLIPLVFPTFSLLAGSASIILIQLVEIQLAGTPAGDGSAAHGTIASVEAVTQLLLVAGAVVMGAYLWHGMRRSEAERASVQLLVRGPYRVWFWVGIVLFVIAVPALVGITGRFVHVPLGILGATAALAVIGEFAVKYTVIASGTYPRMFPAQRLHRLPGNG